MVTLKRAHNELFRRQPDETFASLEDLRQHCHQERESSLDLWERPQDLAITGELSICDAEGNDRELNDWSFSQLCRLAGVRKETINRLSLKTASKVFEETLPESNKPIQFLRNEEVIRSVHAVTYTRLWNCELLDVVCEAADDFTPPQVAADGQATGLYCGEQDLFAFLIDPGGWTEINGESFAPGFFVWNSEVGRRSLGIQTFWFQRICQNHIVWDASEVVEFTRKHTSGVHEGLAEIRSHIESLVNRRDARRDSFARVMRNAMTQQLGSSKEDVESILSAEKIPRHVINEALKLAQSRGAFTIYAVVDALTQLSQKVRFAGERTQLDAKVGNLLALAA